MHRLFSANAQLHDDIVTVTDEDEIHHMRHVLRLKRDSQVCIFNGSGEEAVGRILTLKDNHVDVKIDSRHKANPQKSIPVILACAVPKKAKFEFIIEKCTELGVDEIIPLKTKRTEVLLDKERAEKKTLRYQKKAVHAAKQSQRTTIPVIHPMTDFREVINGLTRHDAAFIPCLAGKRQNLNQAFTIKKTHKLSSHYRSDGSQLIYARVGISSKFQYYKRIIFFIGPEGDFTPQEVSLAIDAGCIPVSLGQNVLKVDTAAISVVALANLLTTKYSSCIIASSNK